MLEGSLNGSHSEGLDSGCTSFGRVLRASCNTTVWDGGCLCHFGVRLYIGLGLCSGYDPPRESFFPWDEGPFGRLLKLVPSFPESGS